MPTTGENKPVSIGAVARATGIGIETLRMWERRYGAPESIRLPSGHRRYTLTEVKRLQAVSRALKLGYRPREVAAAPMDELRDLIARREDQSTNFSESEDLLREASRESVVSEWLDATYQYDDKRLSKEFFDEWAKRGPLKFLKECAAPFLIRVGQEWHNGNLAVSHEHFASEKLSDFLSAQWRKMNEHLHGRPFVVASLPGDLHRLGMQMASTMITLAERRVVYIGPQTPIKELVAAGERFKPAAICLSLSMTYPEREARENCEELKLMLPEDVEVVIGGAGAPNGIPGVRTFTDLEKFFDYVRSLPN